MKQHITPTQASEVTFEEFKKIYMDDSTVPRNDWANFHAKKMTIGKLIQFISEQCKFFEIIINGFGYELHVIATTPFESLNTDHYTKGLGVRDEELIDVLWRITKQLIGKEVE